MIKNMLGALLVGLSVGQMQGRTDAEWAPGDSEWGYAEERTRNAVVQVWAQSTLFDWIYPFSSPEQAQGAGSGFFINAEGYFLTNYHVVRAAKSVHISLPMLGRTLLPCTIVGVCPELDVALVKLTPESKSLIEKSCGTINSLEFGDSDKLYDTQSVLAIGFPLGLRTRKSTVGGVAGQDFVRGNSLIHITAPINPGNSGGPCVTKDGKVVGINCSSWSNSQNYNYIIPSKEILVILDDLYKKSLVRRPDWNIGVNKSEEAHARSLGNPLPAGVFVNYVYKNSLEERVGIRPGDMIYEIGLNGVSYTLDKFGYTTVPWRNKEKISGKELLVRCRVGDEISFVIYRKGQRKELKCTFEEPVLRPVREIYPEYEPSELDYEICGGLVIMQLRENHFQFFQNEMAVELRKYHRREEQSEPALVITTVLVGSIAHLSECFAPGFILDTVNGQKVTTLAELRAALKKSLKSGEIALSVKDRPATVFSLSDVLVEERRLSDIFMYDITESMQQLINSYKKH
jgi:S1-C subfamily serine protease